MYNLTGLNTFRQSLQITLSTNYLQKEVMKSFEITIPVLNEEPTLDKNVRIIHQFIKKHLPMHPNWRIVIADNGSTDRTLEIAKELDQDLKEVTFVTVPRKGVGLALKTSWGQSAADIVGYMDLDLATDLPHFLEAYKAINEDNFDIVYGTRLHSKSKVINRPFKREVASRVFNLLLKIYLGVRFSDGMCGFKFLKRSAFIELHKVAAKNDGWFFSTELLVGGEWLKMKIFELPVTWTDDISSSKVKIIPLAKKYITAMSELKKKRQAVIEAN